MLNINMGSISFELGSESPENEGILADFGLGFESPDAKNFPSLVDCLNLPLSSEEHLNC